MKSSSYGIRSRAAKGAALVAIVVVAIIAWRALRSDAAPVRATAPAVIADIEDTVIATGTLDASQMVSVGAQASGQVKSLKVGLGDRVRAGDLIAEIDDTQQRNEVRDAQAALMILRANRAEQVAALKRDELIFQRQRAMLAEEATPRAEYEAAEAMLASSRARIKSTDASIMQRQINLDTLQAKLGYTRITAPMDGTVVAVITKEGQTVNSLQSAPTIVKLASLDTMLVSAGISEADVAKVRPGQTVYFTTLGNPDKRYYGKLRTVEPAPDSIKSDGAPGASPSSGAAQAVYYNGLFEVPNRNAELRIAMTAQVHVVLAQAKQALTIPSAALGSKGKEGAYSVKVVDAAGNASSRSIRIGINNNADAQVLAGLKAGEKVVIGESDTDPRAPGEPEA